MICGAVCFQCPTGTSAPACRHARTARTVVIISVINMPRRRINQLSPLQTTCVTGGMTGFDISTMSRYTGRLLYTVLVQTNCHPFSVHYSFYKCRPISTIFGTHCAELICNYNNYWFVHLTYTYYCCTTVGKLICCFWLRSPCASDDRAPAAWNSKIHSSRLTASQ